MSDYREDLARLKAERDEIKYRQVSEDILHHDRERMENEQAAQDALARGDSDTARWLVENAASHEQSISHLSAELDQLDSAGGSRQGQLSDAKRKWLDRRRDLASNPKVIEAAGAWHNHLVGTLGYQDDSPEYFSAMQTILEPQGYEPMPTPDDVCKMLSISSSSYNAGVNRLLKAKTSGDYPDR